MKVHWFEIVYMQTDVREVLGRVLFCNKWRALDDEIRRSAQALTTVIGSYRSGNKSRICLN